MNIEKLRCSGWIVGGAVEFLQLSPEEGKIVELKLGLGAAGIEPVAGCQGGGGGPQGFGGSANQNFVDDQR